MSTTDANVKLASVYTRKANANNIDVTRAAKLIRARMRANFATVCELSPNISDTKHAANDGNKWPSHVTRELASYLLKPPPKQDTSDSE